MKNSDIMSHRNNLISDTVFHIGIPLLKKMTNREDIGFSH